MAVDHWNIDNPHIHVLLRGRADDGQDLVINCDYIRQGFRERAADRVTLELGSRSEHEIPAGLEGGRCRALDGPRPIAPRHFRPPICCPGDADEDPELRRLVGRVASLERLGLAEQLGSAVDIEARPPVGLRDLGIRSDIIKTVHRAVSAADPDVAGFALHGDEATEPILGRLVDRGLHDELRAPPTPSSKASTRVRITVSLPIWR